MKLFAKTRPSTVLGLSIDGNRLDGVVMRRSGSSAVARQTVSAEMALAPLTGDPDLVGREIRNHLEAAGIRETNCVVSLPLTWVLTLQAKVPEMPEADVDSFLQIEAERGFTSGHEALYIQRSFFKAPDGDRYVTMLAVPRNHLDVLERALRAAGLKPLAFAMGISAAQSPSQGTQRVLAMVLSPHGLELQVTGGGGVVALRSLDAAVEMEGARRSISSDLVARELRITLGQLPGGFAAETGPIKIFGAGETTRQFITDISPRLNQLSLRIEPVERPANVSFESSPKPEIAAAPVTALAAAYVNNGDVGADFLPPKISPWKQFVTTKLGTQKLAYAGGAAALAALLVGGLFGWQEFQLHDLRKQWNAIAPNVKLLKTEEDNIHAYHPWFDDSIPALTVMARITSAFPEEGSVTAKTLEIRDLSSIAVHGTATSIQAFNLTREKLGKIPGVEDLRSDTAGQPPQVQFNFNFNWKPKNAPEETTDGK